MTQKILTFDCTLNTGKGAGFMQKQAHKKYTNNFCVVCSFAGCTVDTLQEMFFHLWKIHNLCKVPNKMALCINEQLNSDHLESGSYKK